MHEAAFAGNLLTETRKMVSRRNWLTISCCLWHWDEIFTLGLQHPNSSAIWKPGQSRPIKSSTERSSIIFNAGDHSPSPRPRQTSTAGTMWTSLFTQMTESSPKGCHSGGMTARLVREIVLPDSSSAVIGALSSCRIMEGAVGVSGL